MFSVRLGHIGESFACLHIVTKHSSYMFHFLLLWVVMLLTNLFQSFAD